MSARILACPSGGSFALRTLHDADGQGGPGPGRSGGGEGRGRGVQDDRDRRFTEGQRGSAGGAAGPMGLGLENGSEEWKAKKLRDFGKYFASHPKFFALDRNVFDSLSCELARAGGTSRMVLTRMDPGALRRHSSQCRPPDSGCVSDG